MGMLNEIICKLPDELHPIVIVVMPNDFENKLNSLSASVWETLNSKWYANDEQHLTSKFPIVFSCHKISKIDSLSA